MDNLCYAYINICAPHKIQLENAGRHFFFQNKTGESSFLAAEDFELYYRLARSCKKSFLSQLNSTGGEHNNSGVVDSIHLGYRIDVLMPPPYLWRVPESPAVINNTLLYP